MHRVRLSTPDLESPRSVINSTVAEVEDGFVIRGVHKQELGMSSTDAQLRGHSFIGTPAPVYRPRPRPHHLSKESNEARLAESRRWQPGPSNAPRWKVTVQLARLAAHSKLTGQKGVGAAVANQIVAKKWKAVGNLLKATAGGVTRIRALVERDRKTYLQAAQEALRLAAVGVLDVKLTVRSERELRNLSYLHQGDASMYTSDALAQRLAIRSLPRFREAVRAWWQWLPLCTLPQEERITEEEKLMPLDMRGMTKPVYCAMAAIIQRVLLPRFGLKPNPSYEPEEDWTFDCRGKRFLLFPQLLNALFELADMWCPTISEADYVTILTELLDQCKALEGRHGLFSKLLSKYQRRYGAQDEHKLPISGGYVQSFNSATGRAQQGHGGGGGGAVAAVGGEGATAMSPASAAAALMPAAGSQTMDEADAVLKALSDDDDTEDHKATTNWWAKIMERNRRYMEAKANGMGDEAAEAAAANLRTSTTNGPVAASGSDSDSDTPSEPLQFPMALLGSLYDTPPSSAGGNGQRNASSVTQRRGHHHHHNNKGMAVPPMSPVPPSTPPPALRMGKAIKGQTAPGAPSTALMSTLREAVTDALVEVGASTDVAAAASVLTEEGTIAYHQVGPHTLAELIKVLVDYKRMNTRHIRALIGNSFNRGSPKGTGSKAPSNNGSRVVSRKTIALPTVSEGAELSTTAAAVPGPPTAAALMTALNTAAAAGAAGGSTTTSPSRMSGFGGSVGMGSVASDTSVVVVSVERTGGVSTMSAPTAVWGGPLTPNNAVASGGGGGGSSTDMAILTNSASAGAGDTVAAAGGGSGGFGTAVEAGSGGGADGSAGGVIGDNGRGSGGEDSNIVNDGDEAGGDADDEADGPAQVFAARPRTPCMDGATLCAIRATLQGAGLASGDLSSMLASHGLGLASDVQPQVLAHVAKVLAEAGFDTEAIVAFLFPPEAEEDLEAAGLVFNMPLSEVQLEAMRVALRKAGVDDALVDLVRTWTADVKAIQATSTALEASGFTPLEVQRFIAPAASTALIDALRRRGLTPAAAASLLRSDGKGLALDLSPKELAEAADAMATAGFTAEQVVKAIGSDAASVPPLEPAGLDACREALLSEGFTEEELEEVVFTDNGTALQDSIGAATMARVAGALACGGLTSETIRRFLRYDVMRAAQSRLPKRALRAMQSVIPGAIRSGEDGSSGKEDPLLPDGSGVAPDAGVGVVAQIGGALVEAMFNPAQIRAFLMPEDQDVGFGAGGDAAASGAARSSPQSMLDPGPLGQPPGKTGSSGIASKIRGRRQYLSPRDVVVFRSVLMASGFSTQDLMEIVRSDGRGLDPDADSELAAKAVAALSAAGFQGHEIQLFLQLRDPAAAMTPSEAAAARSALVTAGFTPPQLEGLLRRDGVGLLSEPEPDPYVMAQVSVVLAEAGFPCFHICQYLAPAMPLVPIKVLEVGRYFGHSVSGNVLTSNKSMRLNSQASIAKPWNEISTTEDGRLLPEADVSDDDEDRKAEEEAAAAAAASAASERRRQREADAAAAAGEPSHLSEEAEGEAEPTDWVALPSSVLQAIRDAVDRRCKGLNVKQLRQLAPQMANPSTVVAAAGPGGATAATAAGGGSWLPLDPEVTMRVVRALTNEGFSADQIRRFFMQPVAAAAEAGLRETEVFDHVPPPLMFLIRALLKSSGFTDQHLSNMMSADRRRLDPDWDVESGAMMLAALARAGFSAQIIRLLLTTGPPVGALNPNELGTINEALLEAGFSRRQLRLVLRPDHSGPCRNTDGTTLAQMATAMSQAGCSAGQLCQFLGPPPAAFTKPVPLPLLSPLLALINIPQAATSTSALSSSAAGSPSASIAVSSTGSTSTFPTTSLTFTVASSQAPSISISPSGGGIGVLGSSPFTGGVGGVSGGAAVMPVATVAAGSVLDSRSVMDIRNVAASCGFSSRMLADMIRPDGRGLQRHADPRVIDRVGLHMVNQGFTPAQIYRFLLPTGGCEYGQLDPPTSAAVRAVLLAAGFSHAELKNFLTSSNTAINANAPAATLSAVAYSLAASGASADQIRHLLRPPPGSIFPPGSTNGGGGGSGSPTSSDNASTLAVTILKGLMASGYEDHQLDLILRKDGTALRADVGPLRLAQMVAALAAAEVPAATIRMFVRPLGGVQPAVAVSLKAALEQCPGFDKDRVEAAFSPEAYELGPFVEPSTLADIATALSTTGVSGDVIRQLLSLPPGPTPAAPAPQSVFLTEATTPPPATEAGGSPSPAPTAPLLRGRAAGGATGGRLQATLPYTKMLAMREAIVSRWVDASPNPAELLDLHDPAKVVVALADAGYPSEDIRAFVGTDPKLLASPAFMRASGPMPLGVTATVTNVGGSGFVASVLARSGGPVTGMAPMRMSDPGFVRSSTKLRNPPLTVNDRNATSRHHALSLLNGAPPVRFTADGSSYSTLLSGDAGGSPARLSVALLGSIAEQQGGAATSHPVWADFEYRLGGAGGGGGDGTAPALPVSDLSLALAPVLMAEQMLAWLGGFRNLIPFGRTERFPPGLENQLASYLRRVLLRLVGNEVLRTAVNEAIGAGTAGGGGGNALARVGTGEGAMDAADGGSGVGTAAEAGHLPGRRDGKPTRSRVVVKLLSVLLTGLLRRHPRGSEAQSWSADGEGGGEDESTAIGNESIAAARAAAISYILAAVLSKAQGNGGGSLPHDAAAPTVLRFIILNAVRRGVLPSDFDGSETSGRTAAHPPATSEPSINRRGSDPRWPSDQGFLRALPAGYARAWGDQPQGRSGLLESRSPPLVYRNLPQRTNPSHAAAKAGSPRETLPPWPLQRAFVHPHPTTSSPTLPSPSYSPHLAPGPSLYGRLLVDLPGSPSGAAPPSSPLPGYGSRHPTTTTTVFAGSFPSLTAFNQQSVGAGHPLAASNDGSGAVPLVLPPARPMGSGGGGGAGSGARGVSQPPSPSSSGNFGGISALMPRRPSSSGTLGLNVAGHSTGADVCGAGGGSGGGGGGGGGSGVDGGGTRLPTLGRSASTGRFVPEESPPSPATQAVANSRTPMRLAGGGSGGGHGGLSPGPGRPIVQEGTLLGASAGAGVMGPWTGPSAEALFVRLLAEVLRWLEAPAEDSGSSSAPARSSLSGGGWQSWLSLQRARLTSQMTQLESAAMAAIAAMSTSEASSGGKEMAVGNS